MATKQKNPRIRREKNRLSDTLKTFTSTDAIWHLFGKSLKHQLDALLSERWQQENSRRRMLQRVPKHLHGRVEALVAQVSRYRKELESALADGLVETGFTPVMNKTVDKFVVADLSQGRVGRGTAKLIFNLIHFGLPGARSWQGCGELEWAEFLEQEMEYRAHYSTADRHHKHDDAELWNLYARLSPWVATVAGRKLDTDEGADLLRQIVVELAEEFANELDVGVIGIAVHRENDSDLHVHLIFSPTVEKAVEKPLSKTTRNAVIKQIAERIAEDRRHLGLSELGRNKRRALARKELEEKKLEMERTIERQRRRFPRPIQILGPSFRGKLAVWEASGRDEKIARISDRAIGEANTFRERVSDAILRGEDLTKQFIDLWTERRFEKKIRKVLNQDELREIDRHAAQAVATYQKARSVRPCVEDYIVSQAAEMAATLPKDIAKDLEKRAYELDTREQTIQKRERELAGALILTDDVRKEFRVPKTHDARAVLRSLISAKEKAEKRLKDVHGFLDKQLKEGRKVVGDQVWALLTAFGKILAPASKKRPKEQEMSL